MRPAPEFRFTESPDIDAAVALVRGEYWARGVPEDVLRKSWQAACGFGLVDAEGRLVACARVVTDGLRFAWLSDVVVAPQHRGQGLGTALVAAILDDAVLGRVRRFVLSTADAQGLYDRFGFAPADPDRFRVRETP